MSNPDGSVSGTAEIHAKHLTRDYKGNFTTDGATKSDCPNLSPETIYRIITGDFKSLWDSLALNKNPSNGGNFALGLLDMILLEFIATYCKGDKSGKTMNVFSTELNSIDPKYFAEIPNFSASKRIKKLKLPSRSGSYNELIHILFDLIRNGQAHHYQQILVDLKDKRLVVTISGRVGVPGRLEGLLLREAGELNQRKGHLEITYGQKCLFISFRPEIFFLDITKTVEKSGILTKKLVFSHFPARTQIYSSLSSTDIYSVMTAPEVEKILKGEKNAFQ